MRIFSRLGNHARVEVKLVALEATSLGHHPVDQESRVPLTPKSFSGGEVVAVHGESPG